MAQGFHRRDPAPPVHVEASGEQVSKNWWSPDAFICNGADPLSGT